MQTHSNHSLFDYGSVLNDYLRVNAPAGTLTTTGMIQQWNRTTGRFAEGNFSDISVFQGAGTSARFVNDHGLDHRSVSGLDPYFGELSTHSSINSGGDTLLSNPHWMDIDATHDTLKRIESAARDYHPAIAQVVIDFDMSKTSMCLTDGEHLYSESRLLSYLTLRVIARHNGRLSTGFFTPGTSGSLSSIDPHTSGAEVAKRAISGLDARPAPVGVMPVVIAGGRGIVMLHEACCHPLEGDEVVRGSIYADRIGDRIASPLITVTDDPTLPGAVGSYDRDDEAVKAKATPLIQDGLLVGYLTDRDSASRLRIDSTGNGRCSDVLKPPQPRMSNTCLSNGDSTVSDLIEGTPYGIYAENIGGGEMIESTGEFTFRVTNGYLIENGHITSPIEETTISGTGAGVLKNIDGVADDATVGAAKCGKFGQWVPVGVSGPTVRVQSLFVGGTKEGRP